MEKLSEVALQIRRDILRMAMSANGGHIAPSYSMTDILVELYFDGILRYDPIRPEWDERDYFILSKGHGALALYAILCKAGFFDRDTLMGFCKEGSNLGSLAKAGDVPGVEASTGSLGHGLSYGVGIALALKKDNATNKVYVLIGDGECEEGSVWEALMFAAHNKLDNLTIILDNNGFQAMDSLNSIMSLNDFADKFKSFGLNVIEIDGHNYNEIKDALTTKNTNKPKAIVAHTIKGKGISFMENVPIWHYRIPDEKEIEIACRELGMNTEDLGSYEKSIFRNVI